MFRLQIHLGHEDESGPRPLELIPVFGIAEKADTTGIRLIEGGEIREFVPYLTPEEATPDHFRNGSDRGFHFDRFGQRKRGSGARPRTPSFNSNDVFLSLSRSSQGHPR